MKQRLKVVLALCLLGATLFGCTPKTPGVLDDTTPSTQETTPPAANDKLKLNGVGISEYTLVYNKNVATMGGKSVANYFNQKLEDLCGVTLKKTTTPQADRYEIVLGLDGGDAAIAAAAKDQDGFIGVSGKKVYILGLNGGGVQQSIDRFFTKVQGSGDNQTISVAGNENVTIRKTSVKVMTYNILQTWDKEGRPSNFLQKMGETINAQDPDVFGTQESTRSLLNGLKEGGYLDDYTVYQGVPHNTSADYLGNYIYWKTDKYTAIKKGHWFLSDTPLILSKLDGSNSFRGFSYVILEDNATKNRFLFISIHVDYRGTNGDPNSSETDQVRTEQLKILTKFLNEENPDNLPVIIGGDFNATPKKKSITSFLTDSQQMAMTSNVTKDKTGDKGGTLATNGFVKRESYVYDYIFVSTNRIDTEYYSVVNNISDGKYPSDHLPVMAELTLY